MRTLNLSAVVMSMIACGETPDAKRDSATVLPFRTDEAFAERYFVSDEACQANSGVANIGKPLIYTWKDGGVRTLPMPVDNVSSVESLASSGLESTLYSLTQRTTCTITDTTTDCSAGARMIQKPQSLKICATNQSYARTSIEGVALTSLASLSLARQFYQSLPTSDRQLEEATLIVLPTIETVVEDREGNEDKRRRTVLTDNLAYAPNFGGIPAFVVFPKGKKSLDRGLWKDLNLWEMGWGLAHEFGHHVFRWHTEGAGSGSAQMIPIHGFDLEGEAPAARVQKTAAADQTENALGAINEGFADLFGYYTFGGAAGITKGIDCFEKSRDVDSPQFFNGDAKALSSKVLDQFYGVTAATAGSCTEPGYDEIHIIGAIVAHGIDRLLRATPEYADHKLKTNLLLKWASVLGQRASLQTGLDLDDFVLEFVRLLARSGRNLTAAQCQVIREVFPAFGNQWLGSRGELTCAR